jgi:putative ABC transport system permease protein
MMIIGISGCTALLVTGFGIRDSIADVASRQFDEIQIYDIGVDFDSPLDDTVEEELSGLAESGLKGYISIMEKNMDLETEKGVKSIYLVAGEPDEMGDFVDLHTKSGEAIAYPQKGEGVISNKLSEQYGIRVGDTITLSDGDMKSLTLTVSGVQENYIYNYVYISKETWEAQMGEAPECKKAYVNLQEDTDAHVLSAELMKLDEVTSVTVNADTSERIDNMMKSLNIIVLVVILCAAGLAFVVLYNLTNINITERIREIATIKVLGFQKKETASYVFRENIILTGMGILVGLVLGKLLHRFVMNEIRIDLITFHTYVSPVSYLYSAVLTLLFTWIVNRVMGRKLEGISMTESLKSVD